MTESHKRKIGEAVKRGQFILCANCGKKVWVSPYELKRNPPRRHCSMECFRLFYRKNYIRKGESNPAYKNGEKYLRKIALKRDNYTCVLCGFSEKEIMEVDHIQERRHDGRHTLENLQTLCPNCHRRKTLQNNNI